MQQSFIHTDEWKGYGGLIYIGHRHNKVYHSRHFVDPNTRVHTNIIDRKWYALRTLIPKIYRTRKWVGFYLLLAMIKRNFNCKVFDFFIKNLGSMKIKSRPAL
jgi:hypothetical protein